MIWTPPALDRTDPRSCYEKYKILVNRPQPEGRITPYGVLSAAVADAQLPRFAASAGFGRRPSGVLRRPRPGARGPAAERTRPARAKTVRPSSIDAPAK